MSLRTNKNVSVVVFLILEESVRLNSVNINIIIVYVIFSPLIENKVPGRGKPSSK